MTTAFKTKGEIAEWKMVYDRIKTLPVGGTITYQELSTVLGRDFEPDRSPFYKANQELLLEDHRGLINVTGVGYRVVTALEHEIPAVSKHRSARRLIKRSRQWIQNADRSQLAPVDAARFDAIETSLRRQEDMTRRLEQRVGRVEKAIIDTRVAQTEAQNETEERITKLQAALERAGIAV